MHLKSHPQVRCFFESVFYFPIEWEVEGEKGNAQKTNKNETLTFILPW